MEVGTKKSKIMSNSLNNISADINMNGQKLGGDQFQISGPILCKDGTCLVEIRIRIASAMTAMARRNGICRTDIISFASKFKLCKYLATAVFLWL